MLYPVSTVSSQQQPGSTIYQSYKGDDRDRETTEETKRRLGDKTTKRHQFPL